ncbi:hypothetical protein FOA43_000453 [Brettanomyces nanus]|uniref:Altered inheritance of mitochondria protein 9, mitochondrial n=1 Tax=Eeniella nana TaxID=13502 RepID=A0A875RT44_EENNA|nr:uncharacterized protein FOA43_000453 [Brettanomyces nanus]QPG73147.1 hypothetical protein FOA43_000453 [Brettanomyces nanus]
MLSRGTGIALTAKRALGIGRISLIRGFRTTTSYKAKQDSSDEVFTRLNDDTDPKRNKLFEYHWGTWMNNDAAEKQKRITKFSISGLNILTGVLEDVANAKDVDKKGELKMMDGNVNVLTKNLKELTGSSFENIKQVVSIHEGMFHHVYLVNLNNGKSMILRLPYKLYPDYYTSRAVNSEVATTEFLREQLGLKVPKVLAYSGQFDNYLNYPFILSEYIEGDLLMKDWYPLVEGKVEDKKVSNELHKVITPIFDFFKAVTKPVFTGYGSLYFKQDYPQGKPAIDGQEKFVLGPTTLKPYYEKGSNLDQKEVDKFVGPWALDQPLKMVSDLAQVNIASLRKEQNNRHAEEALRVYKALLATGEKLFDLKSSSIPNFKEMIKPRLFIPDLDPMNVITSENGNYFVDFEDSTVTPFILNPAPKFVEYTGPKVFHLSEIPDLEKLDADLKDQYEYMQKRTRNQVYWEKSLAENTSKLAISAAPAVKKIRESFTSALKDKNPKDYLNIEASLADLEMLWKSFSEDHVVGEGDCPIKFTEEDLDKFKEDFEDLQKDLSSTPFAATGGWVPQDVFENLLNKGLIVKDGENYKIDIDKALKDAPTKEKDDGRAAN